MLIILGKTASGKDTIVNELVSKHGFKKLVTYTTRPKRKKEIPEATYHYISEQEFLEKAQQGFFAEYKVYKTEEGIWYYGSAIQDYTNTDEKCVIILTPSGLKDILKLKIEFSSIYLYANNLTIKERLVKRGDKKEEAERRLKQDNIDFKGVENMVDKIIYNNSNDSIENIVNKILEYFCR